MFAHLVGMPMLNPNIIADLQSQFSKLCQHVTHAIALVLLLVPIHSDHAVATGNSSNHDRRSTADSRSDLDPALQLALVESRRQLRNTRIRCDTHQDGAARRIIESLIALAKCYKLGAGRPKSLLRAQKLFETAADLGSSDAHLALGQFFRDGRIVVRDLQQAARHFRGAALQGHPEAMVEFGLILLRTNSDVRIACDWFDRAAQAGDINGIRLLGDCHARSIGSYRNQLRSIEFYTQAAALGDYTASLKLTGHEFKGAGSDIAANEGCQWASDAAARDNQTASKAHAYCLSLSLKR